MGAQSSAHDREDGETWQLIHLSSIRASMSFTKAEAHDLVTSLEDSPPPITYATSIKFPGEFRRDTNFPIVGILFSFWREGDSL